MIAALAAAVALFNGGTGPIEGARLPPDLGASSDGCGGCHVREHAAWRASAHGRAYTNRLFASSYAREPMRWCLYCHAPLPEQIAQAGPLRVIVPGAAPLADEGVGCVACHARDGVLLAARPPSAAALRAHPIREEPRLGTSSFCAGCHQFAFPREDVRRVMYTDEPMQDTAREWARSGERRTCQGCHMPAGAHAWPGVALLRDALSVRVARAGGGVAITLVAGETGHGAPTGDPFRRIYVELCDDEACATPRARPSFGRAFVRRKGAWRLALDNRLGPGEKRTLAVPVQARFYRVLYALAAASTEPDLDEAERTIELARGAVED